MPAYLPCPACQRHVRSHESACPFCAAALPERAFACTPGAACTPIPRDAKRATIIALSLSLAASACSDDTATIPIYGSPVAPQAGASGSGGRGGAAGTGNAGGTANAGTSSGGTANAGAAGAAGAGGATPEPSTDAGTSDASDANGAT